jgi:hypothetical protein
MIRELTQSQKDKALAWFQRKNAGRGCPVCGDCMWKVKDEVSLRRTLTSRPLYVIPISCRSCGHLLFFNSTIIDPRVMDPEEDTTSSQSDDDYPQPRNKNTPEPANRLRGASGDGASR